MLEELGKAGDAISTKDFELFIANHDARAVVAWAVDSDLLRAAGCERVRFEYQT
jgi:hypothetical protein